MNTVSQISHEFNSETVNPARSINGKKAAGTIAQRRKAGKYPTQAQKLAFKALISVGEKYLNREALELLATHPHLASSQREHFANLAQAN